MSEGPEVEVGADIDVTALMAEVTKEVQRKREAGLYPPEVLVELDLPTVATAATGRADRAQVGSALADLQRSSHFTALVTTASRKPIVAPLITAARKGIRSSLTWYMNGILSQITRFGDNTVRAVGLVADRLDEHHARLGAGDDRLASLEAWKAEVEADRVNEALARLQGQVRDLRQRLEGVTAAPGPAPAGVPAAVPPGEAGPTRAGAWSWAAESNFDYLQFENRFRGATDLIAHRQRFYVDLFRDATGPVVDLGPGRGEFLGLLREAGIASYGVERHPDMVMTCREQGLEVVESDALAFLASVEPGSLGGIASIQMVEHLATSEVPTFFQLAHAALAPGAPLAVETINPESLMVFAHAFYVDLGHLRPLHPLTLEFLAQSVGFSSVKVEFLSPPPPEFVPQPLPTVDGGGGGEGDPALGELVASLDENFRRINDLLFGPQDFAIVAHR